MAGRNTRLQASDKQGNNRSLTEDSLACAGPENLRARPHRQFGDGHAPCEVQQDGKVSRCSGGSVRHVVGLRDRKAPGAREGAAPCVTWPGVRKRIEQNCSGPPPKPCACMRPSSKRTS